MPGDVVAPPYVITANDKRGLIVVTGIAVLAFVWSCLLIRIWLRLQSREWRSDDWWLAAATLLDTIQSAILFHLVNLGLGTSLDGVQLPQLGKLGREIFAAQILYILTLLFSKLSILFLYLRLSPGGFHRTASLSLTALSSVWAILSVILISIPCNPTQSYTDAGNCTNTWPKHLTISLLDIATELLIYLIACHLVSTLQMRLSTKFLVILAFSARLPILAIASIRLYYLSPHPDTISHVSTVVVATQWQMGYAIMSSTITGMGPFLKPFDKPEYTTTSTSPSHHKQSFRSQPSTQPRTSSGNLSESYLMDRLPSRSRSCRSTLSDSPREPQLLTADEHFRPTHMYRGHETEIWVGNRSMSEEAIQGHGKLVIGKKNEFKVEVDHVR
ncbi:hypothetical protein BDW02DRAFT_54500 [Decorospora gaudefroyi]|uniref:Rhodopsin domain-containing protein n=1 Tax=Decorospora gaudefroyi TaxID=184978 RepID=A0A6A5K5T4_9PLEO|nr:hypothetical protein BDW02DRAFT_54500 [Decorospora gaudefroyi]